MYEGYVTPEEYADLGYNNIPFDEIQTYLIKASRHIDELTFNRINHYGFEKLTPFQQELIQTVICEHADFIYDNDDIISSIFNKYSINSVSMEFGDSVNVVYISGIPIERATYSLLKQTGLCCRLGV